MADITILLNHSFLSPKVTAPLSHGLYWISCCGPCLSLLLPIWSSHSIPLVSDVLCALPTPHFCTWHPLHLECSSPCPWVPSFFFPTDLNLSFGSSIKSFLISAELCGCMFFFRCSPHIFFYGTDRLLLKKKFFFWCLSSPPDPKSWALFAQCSHVLNTQAHVGYLILLWTLKEWKIY